MKVPPPIGIGYTFLSRNSVTSWIACSRVYCWPSFRIAATASVNEIPKDSDGNFFVGIIEATQEKKLDRRRLVRITGADRLCSAFEVASIVASVYDIFFLADFTGLVARIASFADGQAVHYFRNVVFQRLNLILEGHKFRIVHAHARSPDFFGWKTVLNEYRVLRW